jgi:hypothetical protein
MTLGAIHDIKSRPCRIEATAGVILKHDVPDHVRDIMHHFSITNAMDDLALPKPGAECAQGIQFTLIHARPEVVAAREVERVREDDAEGDTEGCHDIYLGHIGRRAQVIQGG